MSWTLHNKQRTNLLGNIHGTITNTVLLLLLLQLLPQLLHCCGFDYL